MRNRKILFISVLIFMMVLSVGAISAQDADNAILSDSESTISGTVSGDVNIVTENPWATSGELSYDIPTDAKTIKSADVYVNVYSGSASNTRGANANISISTNNNVKNYTESLWIEEGSTDGNVYVVNDHTTKCYSDYMIHYNVTSLLEGLNGSNLKINVDTFKMEGKDFDGRIKLIGLILAYDDGDDDVINYWINDNQIWTNSNTTLTFDTSSLTDVLEASLTNVALSSSDATYKINGNFLTEQDHKSGNYYQYNKWDITDEFKANQNTEFIAIGTAGSYGVSYKNTLSVLKVKHGTIEATVSLASERTNGGFNIVYPGTSNQIIITANSNKNGKYTVQLLANGEVINSTEITLNGESTKVNLIDPTIRPIDEATVYVAGKNLTKVDYTVNLILKDEIVSNATLNTVVLYNGYFAKDLAYPGQDYASFFEGVVSGDIVFVVSDEAYATGTVNRVDSWNVALPENSTIVKAWVYVPYAYGGADSIDLFNVTFNDVKPAAVSFSRDQANVVSTSGYGLIVYDVTDLIKSGDNVFALNKTHSAGAYPSTLIYLYNITGSNIIKSVYITNGADLVGTYGNGIGRNISVDTTLKVDASLSDGAVAYIFGAGATTGRATVIVNGEENSTAWDTSASNAINVYTKDISKSLKDNNDISIVLNDGMFTTLQQIIVTSTVLNPTVSANIKTERNNNGFDIIYPGTSNQITATVETDKHGVYTINLLANGEVVYSINASLIAGANTIKLVDSTIRPIDETTVYVTGKNLTKVDYTIDILLNNEKVSNASLSAVVLYNGYFAKDLAYPGQDYASFFEGVVSGDIVFVVSDEAYATGTVNRVDSWNVALPENSTIVKAWVYVPYAYGGADSIDLFNVTFNDVKPSVVSFSRDQANVVSTSGYGLIVYDVTDLIKSGENIFVLNKTHSAGAYPSTLIYLYNITGSNVIKNVYISNGADLVGTYGNEMGRTVSVDNKLVVDSSNVKDATVYVFGAGSITGRSTIIVNGEVNSTAWDTSASNAINVYTKDISKSLKDNNDISVVLNNGMFMTLQQIIVTTQKAKSVIVAPNSVTKVYNNGKNLVITLKDSNGIPIKNAKITVKLNNKPYERTTDKNGKVTLAISNLVPKNYYTATITFAGDDTHIKSTAKTKVIVKKATVKITAKKKTFKSKVKTKKYTVTLKNNKGSVMKKVKLTLKIKGKTYKATTNSKGKATFKITKLTKKGKHTGKITFGGNKYYNKLTRSVKITIKK